MENQMLAVTLLASLQKLVTANNCLKFSVVKLDIFNKIGQTIK